MLRVISGAVILVFGALTHNPGLDIAGGLASFLVVEGMTVRPVVPWGGFLLILAGAVVVAVIASALPVRRATKLNPVEGLARVD
ncbi:MULTISPECIES: hypothetical protein [Kocuria]|uniref:hypothetical protein n=1 Tax=Kocuria TaxID=57493 RepID=UPI000BF138BE|nr:hypothetical protein [Kocuria sp.]